MPADVVISHLHPHELTYSFHHSLTTLVSHDRDRDPSQWRIMNWNAISCGSGGLVEARNKAAAEFLDINYGGHQPEWMLSIDSDMGFPPDALDMLLAAADAQNRPIVGGLCFAQKEISPDGCGGFRCEPRVTILDWVKASEDAPPTFMGRRHYPVNTVVQCAGTGMAFVLIHRRVFQRLRNEHGDTWFNRVPGTDGSMLGEDVSFCLRAGAAGFPVFVHTGVKVTHKKSLWLGETDYWRWLQVPPAREDTAVLVPVLGRPHHAEPFMVSLRASTGVARVYAICQDDDDDARKAWDAAGATIVDVPAELVSFAAKVNAGYQATGEPWMFVTGSDVRFHPGWLDHAQHVGDLYGAGIVGTNDLGNPAVMAGYHATHFLVRREYADEYGCSWDGPGRICHEGYRHWFVDNEIVAAAQQRGAWQMALGSIVEHLHPVWGKAANDEVYELGQSAAAKDQKLWEWRRERYSRVRAA